MCALVCALEVWLLRAPPIEKKTVGMNTALALVAVRVVFGCFYISNLQKNAVWFEQLSLRSLSLSADLSLL